MSNRLITDFSTLIALERADLDPKLEKLGHEIVAPGEVAEEIGDGLTGIVEVEKLRGKSVQKVREVMDSTGIERGEAECIVLAHRENLETIISDDRKLLRQRLTSGKDYVKDIKVAGFSLLLHELRQKELINDVWSAFDSIIETNSWRRSEVYAANYTFLTEKGYQRDD